MSDPASLATMDVLTKLAPPALYTDANLLLLVTCRAVNLSLERGNCDASCFAYVSAWHDRRARASATTRPDIASVSSAMTWSKNAD